MMRLTALVLGVSLLVAGALPAQEKDKDNPFAQYVFAPELVMQHQSRIGLTPQQRTTITEALQQAQSSIVALQWRIQDEAQKLAELLARDAVNESETLAQVDRVLGIERDIKRAQMTLLVRIKNALTREQQTMLRTLRDQPPRPE